MLNRWRVTRGLLSICAVHSKQAMSFLRDTAKGQPCMIRIPGVCCFDKSTTVLCHTNGAGVALKSDDMEAAFGCRDCHAAVDGKPTVAHGYTDDEILLMFLVGCVRTRNYWRECGYLVVVKVDQPRISKILPRNYA